MVVHVGAPELKHRGRLVWPFGEDHVTAAYELARAHVPQGAGLDVRTDLPSWWWDATGLHAEGGAHWRLFAVGGEHGDVVVLTDEEGPRVETTVVKALGAATAMSEEDAAALASATDPAPRAADFPLGAHVTAVRHDEVLLERLRLPPGEVLTWTRVGPGAAPTEFLRLQEAEGAYWVVLVQTPASRTVGLWAGDEPSLGQGARPVLRRLMRREGAWRYGVCFAPTL